MMSELPDFEDTVLEYTEHAQDYADNYEGRANLEQLSSFIQLIKPGGIVLDVGCAAGRDTALLQKAGFQAIGIDLSDGLLAEAHKRHPDLKFLKADLLKLPFEEQSVDGIWSRASLVHMATTEDAQQAFAEFSRVLKPQGAVYVMVKARNVQAPDTGYESDKISGDRMRFFRYYSLSELSGYAEAAGLEIVEAKQVNEKDLAQHMQDRSKIRDIEWVILTARKSNL